MSPSDSESADPRALQVTALIDRLRPKDAEILRLIVWEELSHAEVAGVFGCSTNAVAIRWHRAIRRLRMSLCDSPEQSPFTPSALRHGLPPGGL